MQAVGERVVDHLDPGRRAAPRRSRARASMPCSAANAAARSGERAATATSRSPVARAGATREARGDPGGAEDADPQGVGHVPEPTGPVPRSSRCRGVPPCHWRHHAQACPEARMPHDPHDHARTPHPRRPGPHPPLRWGVLGTGWIAERFTSALRLHTTQQMYAVGSRSPQSAQRFAARTGAPTAYGSYEALVADPQVDVVYVATPHNYHLPNALLAIEAGKHVLVEKPLALDRRRGPGDRCGGRASRGVLPWRRCGPCSCRASTSSGSCSTTARSGRVDTVIADHGQFFADDHRILPGRPRRWPAVGPDDLPAHPGDVGAGAAVDRARRRAVAAPNGINGQLGVLAAHRGRSDRHPAQHDPRADARRRRRSPGPTA